MKTPCARPGSARIAAHHGPHYTAFRLGHAGLVRRRRKVSTPGRNRISTNYARATADTQYLDERRASTHLVWIHGSEDSAGCVEPRLSVGSASRSNSYPIGGTAYTSRVYLASSCPTRIMVVPDMESSIYPDRSLANAPAASGRLDLAPRVDRVVQGGVFDAGSR